MAYRVPKVGYGKGWKLSFESRQNGTRVTKDIPKTEWLRLGLHSQMTRTEAKEQIKTLNAQEKVKQIEAKRLAIKDRFNHEELLVQSFLPPTVKKEFEQKLALLKVSKVSSHWRAAQRVMLATKLDVSEWVNNPELFYRYFEEKKWSLSYVTKILYLLNLWGKFYARRHKQYYEPIPNPKSRDRSRIADTYFDHSGGGMASEAIEPLELESIREHLKPEHYNWLYLSIWFGLRPSEVDLLKQPQGPTTWSIKLIKNIPVLGIYQSKLRNIERTRRYKSIPCLQPEQVKALEIIKTGQFKRPLVKILKKYFNKKVTCYAGRKGFVALMLQFGYTLEKISKWLGHQSIERTWRSYVSKNEDLW